MKLFICERLKEYSLTKAEKTPVCFSGALADQYVEKISIFCFLIYCFVLDLKVTIWNGTFR